MSRAKPVDNSTAVSLFPFLAVLLCTMGALVVLLVAMSRSAREVARRQTAEAPQPAAVEPDPTVRHKLEQVRQYASLLAQFRSQSQQKLRQDQQRLSDLESHMRRLQEQLRSLAIAAAELDALEEEHYDDREQAEREVARLQQLIENMQSSIEALKQEQQSARRSYALVPYEGPNGTSRRPIYVECRNEELILQPEGVRITMDDLRPPLGAGNPLASALRAAREHYKRLNPTEGRTRDTEPYPLVVIRPSGAAAFGRVQRAIQSSDFEFGYELVEEDWDLKYPVADPQLALVEQQAIDQARIRQQALAAAAPRAYRHPGLAAAGRFEFEDAGSGESGSLRRGDGFTGSGKDEGAYGTPGVEDDVRGDTDRNQDAGRSGTTAGGVGDAGGDGPSAAAIAADTVPGTATNGGVEGGPSAEPSSGSASQPAPAGGASQPAAAGVAAAAVSEQSASSDGATSTAASASDQRDPHNGGDHDLARTRGQDWALQRKTSRAVPIRRTIQVVVRQDQLSVLADDVPPGARAAAGKTLPLKGDTVEAVDDFVKIVHEQIAGWGMAGDGLYWRPILALHVGPDGRRRAEDLARLLADSGLEVRPAVTATLNPQGDSGATR